MPALRAIVRIMVVSIVLIDSVEVFHAEFCHDAHEAYKTCNAPRCKGTAGKSHKVYFITILVIVRKKPVSFPDMFREPLTRSPTNIFVEDILRAADTCLIVYNLRDTFCICSLGCSAEPCYVGGDGEMTTVIPG